MQNWNNKIVILKTKSLALKFSLKMSGDIISLQYDSLNCVYFFIIQSNFSLRTQNLYYGKCYVFKSWHWITGEENLKVICG
jgi:hypothetical protein